MYQSVGGRYRIRIEGSVDLNQSKSTIVIGSDNDPLSVHQRKLGNEKENIQNCLPKQGTLIIKMKNGSKKIIDLSEAETITVVP